MSDHDPLDRLLPPDPGVGRVEPLPAGATIGPPPANLPRHLRDRLVEPAGPDRSAQTAGLVSAAVEWGYDDTAVLTLAFAHPPTVARGSKTDVAADVRRLLGKLRPNHGHVGQPCDKAGCPNAPAWMATAQPSRPSPNGARPADDDAQPATIADVIDVLASYQHLDDTGHIWFALAVAVSGEAETEPFLDDPLWGMLVGPSSSGKTETTKALGLVAGFLDEVTVGGLLSWTKGKNPRPTGALERLPDSARRPNFKRGTVTIGDFSTVLAQSNRGSKDQLFSFLRRIYDGSAHRDLGNAKDALRWRGRLTLLACCTPIIDDYTSHADSLGPRWLYYRLKPRTLAGMHAMAEAARIPAAEGRDRAAVGTQRLITAAVGRAAEVKVPGWANGAINKLAIVACYGRAAVPRSSYGKREITGEASREEPARLRKQLYQLVHALLALGATVEHALAIARRCALDSLPQTRRRALELFATGIDLTASEVARELGCDRRVARFALEELAAAGVLDWPDSYTTDEGDEENRFAPRTWKLSTAVGPLFVSILTGQPWEQKAHAHKEGEEEETAADGGSTRAPYFEAQGPPAADPLFESPDAPDRPERWRR